MQPRLWTGFWWTRNCYRQRCFDWRKMGNQCRFFTIAMGNNWHCIFHFCLQEKIYFPSEHFFDWRVQSAKWTKFFIKKLFCCLVKHLALVRSWTFEFSITYILAKPINWNKSVSFWFNWVLLYCMRAFTYDVGCFGAISDLPTYPNQIRY